MGGGQISPSPIDFHRRPYNTLALPCERVICCFSCVIQPQSSLQDVLNCYVFYTYICCFSNFVPNKDDDVAYARKLEILTEEGINLQQNSLSLVEYYDLIDLLF